MPPLNPYKAILQHCASLGKTRLSRIKGGFRGALKEVCGVSTMLLEVLEIVLKVLMVVVEVKSEKLHFNKFILHLTTFHVL